NVVNLKIPPLRQRPADILALSEFFVAKYARENGLPERTLSEEARTELVRAPWPGNVRELENTLHRAVLLSPGTTIGIDEIRLPDGQSLSEAASTNSLAAQARDTAETVTRSLVGSTVADVERTLILDTLDHCLGNRTHASNILGISIRTLRNKLNQYSREGETIPTPGGHKQSAA
ncbi:MAG TPA: sigma-54-dependent Fis family transcriptional regulator, partial [Devosia sp.]|nr:sigma-54-dependent Fis family transcriptional regulator [Devosia sp.]